MSLLKAFLVEQTDLGRRTGRRLERYTTLNDRTALDVERDPGYFAATFARPRYHPSWAQ